MNKTTSGLKLFTLVMLITGSIDSIRNLPASALFGTTLLFFFVLAAIMFLVPTAMVSAELASTWTKQSGIYHWVRKAFGGKTALIAIWLQWINTMVWYPTILSFIAGTVAYVINPALAHNKYYLVSIILSTFWLLTFINLRGLKVSAKFASYCAVIGMIIPMALIIILAAIWIFSGQPLQIHFTAHSVLPNLQHKSNWISLTAIVTAFLGMELATVHVRQVNNPQRTFPAAMFFSVLIILLTMLFGSLAIAFVLPAGQINLVDGVMQAFSNFFTAYHMHWMIPVIAVMLLIGSLGGMINWIISPAKGLMHAAEDHYLPKFLTKQNKHGASSSILILQAILVSLICTAFLLMPSVNGSYWLLTDLSTELYMMMYVFMFVAAIYLRYKTPDKERPFQVPYGKPGIWGIGLLGIFGCLITVTIGFFPPSTINVGTALHYETVFTCGLLLMLAPVLLLYFYRYFSQSKLNTSLDIPETSLQNEELPST